MKKECFECNRKTVSKLSSVIHINDEDQAHLNSYVNNYLDSVDMNRSNPDIMGDIYQYLRHYLKIHDPYYDIKKNYNEYVLTMYKDLIEYTDKSENPIYEALILAIKGNLIDFGAKHSFDYDMLKELLFTDIQLTIDDSNMLFDKLSESSSLLYLSDNCGEIILDLLFMHYIHLCYPRLKITLALRDQPIINDVCMSDVDSLLIPDYIEVISNSLSTPGYIYEKSSDDMKHVFDNSDVVISKGQGNFEGLTGCHKEDLYYLFMAKCDIVSSMLNVETMSIVCKKNK